MNFRLKFWWTLIFLVFVTGCVAQEYDNVSGIQKNNKSLEAVCDKAAEGALDFSELPDLSADQNAYIVSCSLRNHIAALSVVSGGIPADESAYNAVKNQKVKLLKQLLRRDINTNYKNEVGSNLLASLSKSNIALSDRLEIATSLLEKGVDPKVRNNNGYNAIDYARSKKAPALAKLFTGYVADQ